MAIEDIFKDFETIRIWDTLGDAEKSGEGVSRFASDRHCQTPSDTRFQEIGGTSPNISPNTF